MTVLLKVPKERFSRREGRTPKDPIERIRSVLPLSSVRLLNFCRETFLFSQRHVSAESSYELKLSNSKVNDDIN